MTKTSYPDLNKKIGSFIRDRRRLLRITQKDLATAVSYTPQLVSCWEKSANVPYLSTFLQFTQCFKISLDDLIDLNADAPIVENNNFVFDESYFLKKIIDLRTAHNKSCEELADYLGMVPSTYNKVEKGDSQLDATMFYALAEYYQLKPQALVMDYDDSTSAESKENIVVKRQKKWIYPVMFSCFAAFGIAVAVILSLGPTGFYKPALALNTSDDLIIENDKIIIKNSRKDVVYTLAATGYSKSKRGTGEDLLFDDLDSDKEYRIKTKVDNQKESKLYYFELLKKEKIEVLSYDYRTRVISGFNPTCTYMFEGLDISSFTGVSTFEVPDELLNQDVYVVKVKRNEAYMDSDSFQLYLDSFDRTNEAIEDAIDSEGIIIRDSTIIKDLSNQKTAASLKEKLRYNQAYTDDVVLYNGFAAFSSDHLNYDSNGVLLGFKDEYSSDKCLVLSSDNVKNGISSEAFSNDNAPDLKYVKIVGDLKISGLEIFKGQNLSVLVLENTNGSFDSGIFKGLNSIRELKGPLNGIDLYDCRVDSYYGDSFSKYLDLSMFETNDIFSVYCPSSCLTITGSDNTFTNSSLRLICTLNSQLFVNDSSNPLKINNFLALQYIVTPMKSEIGFQYTYLKNCPSLCGAIDYSSIAYLDKGMFDCVSLPSSLIFKDVITVKTGALANLVDVKEIHFVKSYEGQKLTIEKDAIEEKTIYSSNRGLEKIIFEGYKKDEVTIDPDFTSSDVELIYE